MATGTNSRADATAKVTMKPAAAGDCFTDKQARELSRRLSVTIPTQDTAGDSVVSRTPPEDKTKIWYLADENGIPTGEQFAYNPATGQWESTAQSIPPIPCLSVNSENLITKDSLGCWIVDSNTIVQLINDNALTVSGDAGNAIQIGGDGGIYLSDSFFCLYEEGDDINFLKRETNNCLRVSPSLDVGNGLKEGTDGNPLVNLPKILDAPITILTGAAAAGTINLGSFTTVPSWATHAIVYQPNGFLYSKITTGFINNVAISGGEFIRLAGFIQAQS